MWLHIIQLSGKMKRADEKCTIIVSQESRDMVEEFLESGERLWTRFSMLLKVY
jgi:hypothetical protein